MIKKIINKLFGRKEVMSFKQGFDLTELPVVTFYQGTKKFNFLLDTGSNSNTIDSNILDQVEHTPVEANSSVFGMEGKQQTVPVCNIVLTYKDTNYDYQYLICDMKEAFSMIKQDTGVTLHGILGAKFFNTYRYVLDFAELIAYSKP